MSGKRANLFGQGRPENPYDERDSEPDVPQRATAAQLAQRKIKTAKVRRPGGASGASTPSANFAAPQNFSFGGASAPASNGVSFGASNGAFGGGVNNSFPPAQSSAPSSSFTNSSFPAFGASSQTTGFNPQPPSTGFNFSSGNTSASNPFASLNGASPASSAAPPAFGAFSNTTTSAAPSNPFGGFSSTTSSAAPTTSAPATTPFTFGTTSAAPQNAITTAPASTPFTFGTTSTAAQSNNSTPAPASSLFNFGATSTAAQNNSINSSASATASTPFHFGATSSAAQNNSSAPAPASTPFTFGTSASAPQNNSSTPAISNGFAFGTSTPATTAPTQPTLFSGFTSKEQAQAAAPITTQPSLFSAGGTSQGVTSATTAAPANPLFSFGTSSGKDTTTPSQNQSTPGPAAAPAFSFGQKTTPASQQTPSNPFSGIKVPDSTQKPSLFSSVKTPQPEVTTSTEAPKANLFSSLAKPPQSTAAAPAFSFGTDQNKDSGTTASNKATETSKPASFSLFSTPQPAKTSQAEKPQAGLFSAQPKTSTGIFSQAFQPESNNSNNVFKAAPSFPAAKPQPVEAPVKTAVSSETSNPFAKAQTPSTERSNLFAPAKEQATASSSAMPTLTGVSASADAQELPKIPKAYVPKSWVVPPLTDAVRSDPSFTLIAGLALQLQHLNEHYRSKLSNLPALADWSSLSLWHHQQSSTLRKQLDEAKKQRAQAKGITGNESSLSVKRKVNDQSPEEQHVSPSKRARPADPTASPTPASKSNPTPTATSSLFAKAINTQPAASPEPASLFTPKASSAPATEPSKFGASNTGFKPAVPGATGEGAATPFSLFKSTSSSAPSNAAGGFKPMTSNGTGGFKPTTGGSGSSGFASQFAAKAKTYEQLRAERKKKAKDADYDSDDETEEQWSARWDKEEDARLAKEKAETASASGFSMPSSAKTSGASTPASNLFSLAKPATTISAATNGLFSPRPASPALSTGSQSVFDAPSRSQAASPNIFGHLSSGPSSNQDQSDDEDEAPTASVETSTSPKQQAGYLGTDSEEDAPKPKKQDVAPKGSLLSRMTRPNDEGSESERESISGSLFGGTNGTTTPKPFTYFNFEAAGNKSAPPKSDTYGGDQTFKVGTPIKFGGAPATEKKADNAAPTFSFQPASTSTTPSKPPPSFFNFGSNTGGSSLLAPAGGLSGLNSAPSSVFSSRAATPLSEAETSAQSAAEDEEEKQEQVDLSQLTDEELKANDIVFETPISLAKHLADKGDGTKTWEIFAKGPLWILKDKVTGKCFVRIRIPSGATPLNYNILPALKAQVKGSNGKSVQVTMPKKEGGFAQIFVFFKTPDVAEEFTAKYNESLPA